LSFFIVAFSAHHRIDRGFCWFDGDNGRQRRRQLPFDNALQLEESVAVEGVCSNTPVHRFAVRTEMYCVQRVPS
jgi:hypothetical protein